MSPHLFALFARLHGLLGVLSLVVLVHPLVTLRTRKALTRWTVRTSDLGAAGLLSTFIAGWWLYPYYRARPKLVLLVEQPFYADLFESKEHLAVVAVSFAVGGALTLRLAGRHPAGRATAWSLLGSALILGVLVAVLGLLVAGAAHPAW